MTGDSEYHVGSHDWPIGARTTEEDLTAEQVFSVLDLFDSFYADAVNGLAATSVPELSESER